MRPLAIFLGVAFASSWAIAAIAFAIDPGPIARTGLYALFMWGPALGALVAQRTAGERVLAPLGATIAPNRWWLVAWLAPLLVTFATLVIGAMMPDVTLSFDASTLLARVGEGLPASELAEAQASIASIPPPALVGLMIVQSIIAGISINALAAFGEELGWRGFLHVKLGHVAFWRRALLIGVIWGAWHAPVILMGHNYPAHPVLGVFMMIAFTTLLAAPFELIRERGNSVVAASVLHGSINATAGLAIVFLRGGSDLLVGVTGLVGFLVLAVVNVGVYLVRRRS